MGWRNRVLHEVPRPTSCENNDLVRTTEGVESATVGPIWSLAAFGVFLFVVVHEDQGFPVIWGWRWCFRDTDCCPATHFHPFLSFGGGDWGITQQLVHSLHNGHCLRLLAGTTPLSEQEEVLFLSKFSAFTLVLGREGGTTMQKADDACLAPEVSTGGQRAPWSSPMRLHG